MELGLAIDTHVPLGALPGHVCGMTIGISMGLGLDVCAHVP